jgi:hypothetical protein
MKFWHVDMGRSYGSSPYLPVLPDGINSILTISYEPTALKITHIKRYRVNNLVEERTLLNLKCLLKTPKRIYY